MCDYEKTKGDSTEGILWVLNTILHGISTKRIAPCELSERLLNQQRGILELYLMKFKLKSHLANHWLDEFKIPPEHKVVMRSMMESHESFFIYFGSPNDADVDLSWQAGWAISSSMIARLMSEIVFGSEHDRTIMSGLRSSKSADEMLELGPLAEKVQSINDAIEEEGAGEEEEEGDDAGSDAGDDDVEFVSESATGPKLDDIVGEKLKNITGDNRDKLQNAKAQAVENVKSQVVLVSEQDLNSHGKVQGAFEKSKLHSIKATPMNKIIAFYDVKCAGEAVTNPSTRLPSFRANHYKK